MILSQFNTNSLHRKAISFLAFMAFLLSTALPPAPHARAQGALGLPMPGTMVALSTPFQPSTLVGLKVYPKNPFQFDFILNKGDSEATTDSLKNDATKLMQYFLVALTVPEKDLWVNLSPYEKDRIIPDAFGKTGMGRDLLAEDYLLKQITASALYPEGKIGEKFWARVYAKAFDQYGSTDIPLDTFNKVWIVPEKALLYENGDAGTAYIVNTHFKVMLESDYVALDHAVTRPPNEVGPSSMNENQKLTKDLLRELVLPELEKEVNEGRNFATLRQVYHSLLLATWFKKKIKDGLLAKIFIDRNKTAGTALDDPAAAEKIWEQYVESFQKGVYNYIKEDIDPLTQEALPRQYFSGGVVLNGDYASTSTFRALTKMGLNSMFRLSSLFRPLGVKQQAPSSASDSIEQALSKKVLAEEALTPAEQALILEGDINNTSDLQGKKYIIQSFQNSDILYHIESYDVAKTSEGDVYVLHVSQITDVSHLFLSPAAKSLAGYHGWSSLANNYVIVFDEMINFETERDYQKALQGTPIMASQSKEPYPEKYHAADQLHRALLLKAFEGTSSAEQRSGLVQRSMRTHEITHETFHRMLRSKGIDQDATSEDEYMAEIKSMIDADEPLHVLAALVAISIEARFALEILSDLTGETDWPSIEQQIRHQFLGASGTQQLKERAASLWVKAIRRWETRYGLTTQHIFNKSETLGDIKTYLAGLYNGFTIFIPERKGSDVARELGYSASFGIIYDLVRAQHFFNPIKLLADSDSIVNIASLFNRSIPLASFDLKTGHPKEELQDFLKKNAFSTRFNGETVARALSYGRDFARVYDQVLLLHRQGNVLTNKLHATFQLAFKQVVRRKNGVLGITRLNTELPGIQSTVNGGIDLTSDRTRFEVKSFGPELRFIFDPAMIQQFENITGFSPVVTDLQPLISVPAFLEIKGIATQPTKG